MSQQNACSSLILLFLIFQSLAIIALTIPFTNTVSMFNSTILPAASSTPIEVFTSQGENATSPSALEDYFDYRITGTPLVLRITELGSSFTKDAVNKIIDAAIRMVVAKINTGFGPKPIEEGRFWALTTDIDMHITALENAELSYFLLGKQFTAVGGW